MIKKFLLGTGLLTLSATTLAGQAWLFRHAETAPEDEPNPHLSEAGLERATKLADMVGKIDRVYATEYRRTQQTAAILADMNGLPIVPYDPSDMASLAAEVRAFEGTVAIAGHSNTTPMLVHLLGGNPQSAIDSHEYDRVYHLHWDSAQSPVTTTLLYSEPRWLDSDLKLTGFPIKSAALTEYSLTFNMLLRGTVAGTATWTRRKPHQVGRSQSKRH